MVTVALSLLDIQWLLAKLYTESCLSCTHNSGVGNQLARLLDSRVTRTIHATQISVEKGVPCVAPPI